VRSCTSASVGGADIFRRFAQEYRRQFGRKLTVQQDRALRELMVCRTDVMVGTCGSATRAVPGGALQLVQESALPEMPEAEPQGLGGQASSRPSPIEYHHVIFTVPRPVTRFALANPTVLYR